MIKPVSSTCMSHLFGSTGRDVGQAAGHRRELPAAVEDADEGVLAGQGGPAQVCGRAHRLQRGAPVPAPEPNCRPTLFCGRDGSSATVRSEIRTQKTPFTAFP